MTLLSSIPPCSFPHTPGRAKHRAGPWKELWRVLPQRDTGNCLGNILPLISYPL